MCLSICFRGWGLVCLLILEMWCWFCEDLMPCWPRGLLNMQLWGWINSTPEVLKELHQIKRKTVQATAAEGAALSVKTSLWDLYGWHQKNKKFGKAEFWTLILLDLKKNFHLGHSFFPRSLITGMAFIQFKLRHFHYVVDIVLFGVF